MTRGWTDGAKPAKSLTSWLYRVTHNLAVDYIRRENRLKILHRFHLEEGKGTDGEEEKKPAKVKAKGKG